METAQVQFASGLWFCFFLLEPFTLFGRRLEHRLSLDFERVYWSNISNVGQQIVLLKSIQVGVSFSVNWYKQKSSVIYNHTFPPAFIYLFCLGFQVGGSTPVPAVNLGMCPSVLFLADSHLLQGPVTQSFVRGFCLSLKYGFHMCWSSIPAMLGWQQLLSSDVWWHRPKLKAANFFCVLTSGCCMKRGDLLSDTFLSKHTSSLLPPQETI